MPEVLRPTLRVLLGLALLALAALEIQALQATLGLLTGRRAEVAEHVRLALLAARPSIRAALETGGALACLREARRWLPASEQHDLELLGPEGPLALSRPGLPRIAHWPSETQRRALAHGDVVIVGPVPGPEGPRLLSYLELARSGRSVLRVSSEVPDLAAQAEAHRKELGRHAATLAVLFLGTLLALLPGRGEPSAARRSDPYEEAMVRLRRQGEERSRELERLRELADDREAMARAGELSAGMAHELRNGLGTIVGYARLLQQDPSAAGEAGERIRSECAALEHVIKRFSEFVRHERLQLARFDLRRTVQRLLARELQARDGAAAEIDAGPELPVAGDEDLLERALENLVRNAREAAGPRGHVTLSLAREGQQTRVSIADDGPGLGAEVRQSLRPFFTTKPGGLGLGLPLVAKIAALHGGRLELLDRSPHGLVAALVLPDRLVTESNAGGARLRDGPPAPSC